MSESVSTRDTSDVDHQLDFSAFVETRWRLAVARAYRLTLDPSEAEELAQDSFVRVWEKWDRIASQNPDAYLQRVLTNRYLSRTRRLVTMRRLVHVLRHSDSQPDPAEELSERDMLLQALQHLTPTQRAVVLLRFVEDLSVAQVADILGCSTGSIKTHTSRALATLRQILPTTIELPT